MAISKRRTCRPARTLAAVCLLGLAVPAGVSDASAAETARGASCSADIHPDPFDLYGESMRFRVLRNGSPVGAHTVTFRRQGRDIAVETQFSVEVPFLFVTAYRYEYRAVDTWRNGCLSAMQVWVNDDGARHEVVANTDGDRLIVDGPRGRAEAPLAIYPTHHWNAGVVGSREVLNTITGRIAAVQLVDQGIETVTVNGEPRPARHFAYTGELRTHVWYDDRGRWVKMRFAGADGSTIEYGCEACARDLTASR